MILSEEAAHQWVGGPWFNELIPDIPPARF